MTSAKKEPTVRTEVRCRYQLGFCTLPVSHEGPHFNPDAISRMRPADTEFAALREERDALRELGKDTLAWLEKIPETRWRRIGDLMIHDHRSTLLLGWRIALESMSSAGKEVVGEGGVRDDPPKLGQSSGPGSAPKAEDAP